VKRIIFHVDVNSAYLSWEASRRISEGKEDIRLIPSAICGDPEKRTSVILAKSPAAKKYGVKTGEAVSSALRKCPNLFLARPDFHLYERCSAAFMDICREYTPVVEKFSTDECFLDMSGMELIYSDPIATAYEIKDRIKNTLNFTVNIGIGENKLTAKMAGDFEKPDKVHTLFSHEIKEKMWPLPIRDLFSVGAATADKLEKSYITTIGELARSDLKYIQHLIGEKIGEQLHNYANGRDISSVSSGAEEAKCYSISTTLEEDITKTEDAHNVLRELSDSIASRLRADKLYTSCVTVSIRSCDFKNSSHGQKLDEPTDITSEIYSLSKRLFDEHWDKHTPLRLIGIALSSISDHPDERISLFPDHQKEKSHRVDLAVDSIRNKYGSDMIMRASSCVSSVDAGKKYKAQIEEKSKIQTEK